MVSDDWLEAEMLRCRDKRVDAARARATSQTEADIRTAIGNSVGFMWYRTLIAGQIAGPFPISLSEDRAIEVLAARLRESFSSASADGSSFDQVMKQLRQYTTPGDLRTKRGTERGTGRRLRVYIFAPLPDLRNSFTRSTGVVFPATGGSTHCEQD